MSYKEDGKELENLSAFTGNGFDSFPNLYEDNKHIGEVSQYEQARLDYMTNRYGRFLQEQDLMPRAKATADRILNHLIFELAYRDDALDVRKLEDETCTN